MEERVAIYRHVLGATGVRSAVLCNGVVYGDPIGLPAESDMVAALARGATTWGRARHIGRGLNRWSNVHVDDMADLYAIALRAAPPASFFFVENGEEDMRNMTQAIADRLDLGAAEPADIDQAEGLWGHRLANYTLGSNSRVRGTLGRTLGWIPTRESILEWLRDSKARLTVESNQRRTYDD